MIFIPSIWYVKIGYTGSGAGIGKRRSSVSKAAPGFAIPIAFAVLPFAWHIEQGLHELFGGLRRKFYKGDGHSETFLFPAHIMFVVLWAVTALEVLIGWEVISSL